MTNSTVTIYEVMSQTKGIRMSRFGITNMWVVKIICFSNAHGDVDGDWFLGPELQLSCNCSYQSNAYLGVWHSSKYTADICIDSD